PPGILTIYERDKAGAVAYVGDARLSGFPIGETRLLAYALDEKITIEREPSQTDRIASGTIVDGALRFSRLIRQSTTYRVRRRGRTEGEKARSRRPADRAGTGSAARQSRPRGGPQRPGAALSRVPGQGGGWSGGHGQAAARGGQGCGGRPDGPSDLRVPARLV